VLQPETAALLASPVFREVVDGMLFAACDAMGAKAGETWLRSRSLPLLALCGLLTTSPLQREESIAATGLPVFSRQDLARPRSAVEVLSLAEGHGAPAAEAAPRTRRETVGVRPVAAPPPVGDLSPAPVVEGMAAADTHR
jgi:hypothetical protein